MTGCCLRTIGRSVLRLTNPPAVTYLGLRFFLLFFLHHDLTIFLSPPSQSTKLRSILDSPSKPIAIQSYICAGSPRIARSNPIMEHNTEHDEIVSQFCLMTRTGPEEVGVSFFHFKQNPC